MVVRPRAALKDLRRAGAGSSAGWLAIRRSDDPPRGEAALRAAWSLVGRKHYTDMKMLAGDARKSAEAVKQMLVRAETELAAAISEGRSALSLESSDRARAVTRQA